MPTYSFECKECENIWDEFFKTIAKSTKKQKCPKCKSDKTTKLISNPYVTMNSFNAHIVKKQILKPKGDQKISRTPMYKNARGEEYAGKPEVFTIKNKK